MIRKSRRRKSPVRRRSVRKSRRRKSPVRRRSVRKSQLRNYYAPQDMQEDTETQKKRGLEETDTYIPTQKRKLIPKKQTASVSVPNSAIDYELNEHVYDESALNLLKELNINDISREEFRQSIKGYLSSFNLYRCITLDELEQMKTNGYWDTLRDPNHQNIVSVGKWIAHQKMGQYSSTGLDFQKLLKHAFCGEKYKKICMISINLADVINLEEVRIILPQRLRNPENPEIPKEAFKIYTRFNTTEERKSQDIIRKESKYNLQQRVINIPTRSFRQQKRRIITQLDIYPAFNKSLTDRWSDGQVVQTSLTHHKHEKFSRAQNNFRAAWAVGEVALSGIVNLDLIKVVADNSKTRKHMEEIPARPVPVKLYNYPKLPTDKPPMTFEETLALADQLRSRPPIRSYRTKTPTNMER